MSTMKRLLAPLSLLMMVSLWSQAATAEAPDKFAKAKVVAKNEIYFDQTDFGTLYCGCSFEWKGRSGGVIDKASCGYVTRKQEVRASRLEWEHIVPASSIGKARQCWQKGGRKNCNATDPVFSRMEADLFNLYPSVGEVNADRSDYRFGVVQDSRQRHGQCDFRVDFKGRKAQPREAVRGIIARTYFYMFDRYGLRMSKAQEALFMEWNAQYPVSQGEMERESRTAAVMGHHNEFVTGEKIWAKGRRTAGDGTK